MCTGGELFEKIIDEKCFSEKKAADTMRQILGAVNYCHKNKIVHRFYLTNKLRKITDLGI